MSSLLVIIVILTFLQPPIPLSVWGTVVDRTDAPYTSLAGDTLTAYCDGVAVKEDVLGIATDPGYEGQVVYAMDMTCAPGASVTFQVGATVASQPYPLAWAEGASYHNFTLRFSSRNVVAMTSLTQECLWNNTSLVLFAGLLVLWLGLYIGLRLRRG